MEKPLVASPIYCGEVRIVIVVDNVDGFIHRQMDPAGIRRL